ncbi:MAG: glycosyltransferase family 39 protein [Alphaproteobacteria bacterium]|nr:glycosyltransferase family 39 protein [Alphaproteobacteria bacterium]
MTHSKLTYARVLFYILWLLLILSLGQTIYVLLFSGNIIFDDIEHLRASYFVSLGDVPYRDFFEHHHPLLWYVLAPVVSVLPHDTITAVRIGRFISLAVSFIGGYFIYKTEKKFIGGTLCALFCLVFYFWGLNSISSAGLCYIKPDIYQRCCFFIGLYYLFCYFRYQKFRDLQICALLWTLAFLFLQTTVFFVAPLAVPVCYFLYKNPQKWADFAKAAVLPLTILAVCVAILWKLDLLARYFETNWLLNRIYLSIWFEYNHPTREILHHLSDILLITSCSLAYLIYSKKFNIFYLALISMLVCEFLSRFLLVTPFRHYYTWLIIYTSMVSAPFLAKASLKYKNVAALFAAGWLLHTYGNMLYLNQREFVVAQKYIPYTHGETIFSQFFEKRPSYYWMYPLPESIDDVSFEYVNDYSLEKIYKQNNPQYILYPPKPNEDYEAIRKILKFTPEKEKILLRHILDKQCIDDFLNKNYEEIQYNIYQRKDTLPATEGTQ